MSRKILIVVIHPDLKHSVVHNRWIKELEKFPDKYVIHNLYSLYPDAKIDVEDEQALLENFDTIVFQFPIFWFNCPPLLKQWLDEVLIQGWAFGSKSEYKLKGKKIALAVSAGIDEDDYQPTGKYKYTMDQLLAPFELTFDYIRAEYQRAYVFYGLEFHATRDRIEKSASGYIDYLRSLESISYVK